MGKDRVIKSGIEGERRFLSLVFADLSGFTAISKRLDPEEVRDVANLCFEYLNRAIINQGGTIYKYEGDLVIALFGLPQALEDDPERAVKAALEMMAYLPEINKSLRSKLKIENTLGLHIGIHTGTVYVGEVGTAEKREYSVMGDVVNFASRLKDRAQNGEILTSEVTYRMTRYLFDYEPIESQMIKGIDQPVRLFKLLRIKSKPLPKRGIQELYSPMVGRDRELELLRKTISESSSGEKRVIFVTGEAGVGKSRLVAEVIKSLDREKRPFTVFEGRCLSYGKSLFYHPFLSILRSMFNISEKDSNDSIREKLLSLGPQILGESYKEILPYIAYMFAIRFEGELDEKVKYLDPGSIKIQIFSSMRRLIDAFARKEPVLIIIEDYHWIDPESLELLEYLIQSSDLPAVAFICLSRIERGTECYRVKERIGKGLNSIFLEVTLKPLEYEASSMLVYNLLKIPGITENFKDRILAKAEGNPFFLEEIIRSLIDAGFLVFTDGVWRLTTDVASIKIPDTVQSVIIARLDRLEAELKEVLQLASVIGKNFEIDILEALCNVDSLILSLHLSTLEAFEFIKQERVDSKYCYQFRHPVVHEVVYQTLLKKKRMELHRQIGSLIEKRYPDRLEELTEVIAHQYNNSNDPEKAIEWLIRAGKKAKERWANDEAIRNFQNALVFIKQNMDSHYQDFIVANEALGDLYDIKGDYNRAIDHFSLITAYAREGSVKARAKRKIALILSERGKTDEGLKMLDKAEAEIRGDSLDDMLERSEIRIFRCSTYRTLGMIDKAIEETMKEIEIVKGFNIDEKEKKRIIARAYNNLGLSCWVKGDYQRAIQFYKESFDIYIDLDYKRGVSIALNNLGLVYMDQGDYERAQELFQKKLAICEEIGHKNGSGIAYNNLGDIHFYKGEYEKAIDFYLKDLAIAEECGSEKSIGLAYGCLGNVYKEMGRYARAIEEIQKFLKTAEDSQDKFRIGEACCSLTDVYLEMGELRKAEEYLLRAEKVIGEIQSKDVLKTWYLLMVQLALAKGEFHLEQILEYVDNALRYARELGSKSGEAYCYFVYGKIYATKADFTRSAENYQKAIELFDKIGRKRLLADTSLNYAALLKRFGKESKTVDRYLMVARDIYQSLKLDHKLRECERFYAEKDIDCQSR